MWWLYHIIDCFSSFCKLCVFLVWLLYCDKAGMWLLDTVHDSDFKQNVLIVSLTSELVQLKSIQRYLRGQWKHHTIYNSMHRKQNKNITRMPRLVLDDTCHSPLQMSIFDLQHTVSCSHGWPYNKQVLDIWNYKIITYFWIQIPVLIIQAVKDLLNNLTFLNFGLVICKRATTIKDGKCSYEN